jgi:hypothetical protein
MLAMSSSRFNIDDERGEGKLRHAFSVTHVNATMSGAKRGPRWARRHAAATLEGLIEIS